MENYDINHRFTEDNNRNDSGNNNLDDKYINNDFNRHYNFNDPQNRKDYHEKYRNEGWWRRTKDELFPWLSHNDTKHHFMMNESLGEHKGKGPKNYTRRDERIKEDVCDKLSEDSFLDASDIEIEVEGHEVTLNGYVNSKYSKHRAEDLVEDVSGVTQVQNNLKVKEENRS